AYGVRAVLDDDPRDPKQKVLSVVLTEALRFRDKDDKGDKLVDLRAYSNLMMRPDEMIYPPAEVVKSPERLAAFEKATGPLGGAFADLLAEYLAKKDPTTYEDATKGNTRASVPPNLLAEGERTQPNWLLQFLLNPQPIRPMTAAILRMPRFN